MGFFVIIFLFFIIFYIKKPHPLHIIKDYYFYYLFIYLSLFYIMFSTFICL